MFNALLSLTGSSAWITFKPTGRTRLDRLIFIGQHSVSLCVDALKAAVGEAKRGRDIGRYKLAQETLALVSPDEDEAEYDKNWVDRVMKDNSAKAKRLEDELKGYKNNLIKESIRVCTNRMLWKLHELTS
jgi:COP9 signalosome complex subunit 1